ncbi:MAG TPA: DUF932 domain-containing protein [Gemmataceae bacterium]|nr:DUF932 domain-containing protein [Gemmataceae bacterium]
MTTSLITHCGARVVTRPELDLVEPPPATATWFPVKHSLVIDTVSQSLQAAGFQVERMKFALSRGDARLFATMDLASALATGVNLAVGIRNSTDKSLPLGFVAGARVFVCDNMAFRSELLVTRKHTRNGATRFQEAICQATQALVQFREIESQRIRRFQELELSDVRADSVMLRAYEHEVVSHRLLPQVIKEWRTPSFEEFSGRTAWSLLNAFTAVLGGRLKTNPQQFAALTMRLQDLLDRELFPVAAIPALAV